MERAIIRDDFDRIAALGSERWDNNTYYHSYLLRQLKSPCADALDVGCGSGLFTRALAARCANVTGIDLSPVMIERAGTASGALHNVHYRVADVMADELPGAVLDCIASIATLHHLPIERALIRMKSALAAGGILMILDLYRAETLMDHIAGAVAACFSMSLRLLHTGRLRSSRAARLAWQAHARNDHHPTLREVRGICERLLPGAHVRRHLLWRYSIIWQRPHDERAGAIRPSGE